MSSSGRGVRFIASGGYADQDPDVLADLLERARVLADAVLADTSASPELKNLATDFLERISSDTLD